MASGASRTTACSASASGLAGKYAGQAHHVEGDLRGERRVGAEDAERHRQQCGDARDYERADDGDHGEELDQREATAR